MSKNLFDQLYARSLKTITNVRKNMANKFMDMQDKILLLKRLLIETINDQLEKVCQIEHTRTAAQTIFWSICSQA
ncbi:MAG: hypothetical protein CMJ19_15120 [Phycisphaeraceae bacterium]|nr:hypothetical protein [Phycisphaeraceae bacterium]